MKKTMNTNCCMNERVCRITLINPESGKEIGSFDDISEINVSRNTVEENADYKEYNPIVKTDERVLSFTTDTLKVNQEVLGVDLSKTPDQVGILVNNKIQTRKHHKKRINKKWLKRYGYEEQLVDLGQWNYKQTDKPGEYEFERRVI